MSKLKLQSDHSVGAGHRSTKNDGYKHGGEKGSTHSPFPLYKRKYNYQITKRKSITRAVLNDSAIRTCASALHICKWYSPRYVRNVT
jgi:hypothetical protein